MEVYVVVKKAPITKKYPLLTFNTNEGTFATEELANKYIHNRLAENDRDDKNCNFTVEPWYVQETDTLTN